MKIFGFFRRLYLVCFGLIFLSSCAPSGTGVKTLDTPTVPIDIKQEGASSGGGGYSQQATHQMLEIAKDDLAEKILNASDEFFQNFPEKYSKKYLAQIIKNIQFKPEVADRVQRDGSYLKMNYDKETDSLFALHDFYIVYNFPSLMSLLKKPKKFREALQNIQTDIIHELSHLVGVGTSATSNFTSEIFSEQFFLRLGSLRYVCENESYEMAFFPSEKVFLLKRKTVSQQSSFIAELKDFYPKTEADINDIFNSYESAETYLVNSEEFWDEFELAELSKYYTGDENEGSVFLWDQGVSSLLTQTKETSDVYKVFGFLFNGSKNGQIFESQILDKAKSSQSSSETVVFNTYSQKLNSRLEFNSDFSVATWQYDLKVEFEDELNEEQKQNLIQAQKDRGQLNLTEIFSCQKIVNVFPLKPFLDHPVDSVQSPNFTKILKALAE